jgi:hypothetical protein
LFSWKEGLWQIDPGVTAGPDRTRLLRHPAVLLREGLDCGYPEACVIARLGSYKSVFILEKSAASADITGQVVTNRLEMRVPLLLDGVRSLEEVARASGVSLLNVSKIAFTLFCFQALRHVEAGADVRGEGRLAIRDLSIDRDRIQARYALAIESDYFTALGVDRFADANDIRRAYIRLSKELAPETLGPELWHEFKKQIESICEVLSEGLRILSTPILRSSYEFNLAYGPDSEGDVENRSATPAPTTTSRG